MPIFCEMLAAIGALESNSSVEARIEADLAFHEAILQAAGNQLCLLVFTVIQRSILESMEQSARWMKLGTTVEAHNTIYKAIQKGDAAAARRGMREHLTSSKKSLRPGGGRRRWPCR